MRDSFDRAPEDQVVKLIDDTALTQQNIINTVFGSRFEHPDQLARDIAIRKRYMEYAFFSLIPAWVLTRLGFAHRTALTRIDRTIDQAIQQRRRVVF